MESEYELYKQKGIVAATKEKKIKVYLAGPIFNCTDEECRDWREYATKKIVGTSIDPMRRDYRGIEEESIAEIVELDKLDIMEADYVLVNYGDIPPGSVGTAMEILFAWEQHKTVYIVTTQPKVSPWLTYHSTLIFTSLDDAILYINEGWDE
jgi:nucleoside 2-deoxyribosyltransferase